MQSLALDLVKALSLMKEPEICCQRHSWHRTPSCIFTAVCAARNGPLLVRGKFVKELRRVGVLLGRLKTEEPVSKIKTQWGWSYIQWAKHVPGLTLSYKGCFQTKGLHIFLQTLISFHKNYSLCYSTGSRQTSLHGRSLTLGFFRLLHRKFCCQNLPLGLKSITEFSQKSAGKVIHFRLPWLLK